MNKKEMNELIKPNELYTLHYLKKHKIFGTSIASTIKDKILKDSVRENHLKADYTGEGRRLSWIIKGKNIIKYLTKNNLIK